jgi:hypothetical protein
MNTWNRFFIIVLLCILHLSCHSSKKEVRSEQTDNPETVLSTVSKAKELLQDSMSSMTLEKHTANMNDTIIGVLYVSGNEPFTSLVITPSPDVRYAIEADSALKVQLWQLQGKKISIIGTKKPGLAGTNIHVKSFERLP